MKPGRKIIVLSLWLLTPCLALGQTEGGSGDGAGSSPQGQANPASRQMYEDVEIMRRLLLGKLQSQALSVGLMGQCTVCHNVPVQGEFKGYELFRDQTGEAKAISFPLVGLLQTPGHESLHFTVKSRGMPEGEGVYLKGQGLVYSLTMPPWDHEARKGDVKVVGKSLSDWERIRQQMRGDKKEPVHSPLVDPSPADLVLKVLAENGKNIMHLGDNESISVAITFREADKSANNQGALMGSGTGMGGDSGSGGFGMMPPGGGQGAGGGLQPGTGSLGPMPLGLGSSGPPGGYGPGTGSSPGGLGTSPPATAHDYELLGDLHVRQGNIKQAIEAYEQGVKRASQAKERASLYQKLASAHLAPGQTDQEAALQKASEFLKLVQEERTKAAKPGSETPTPPLPSKLVITASKRLLDQVGSGKIGFEEFKKSATVETLTFPTPEKKSGK